MAQGLSNRMARRSRVTISGWNPWSQDLFPQGMKNLGQIASIIASKLPEQFGKGEIIAMTIYVDEKSS